MLKNNINSLLNKLSIFSSTPSYSTKDLNKEVVVITGASRGIGLAAAKRLYNSGANLVLISTNKIDLNLHFASFDKNRTLLLAGDVSNERSVNEMANLMHKKFGTNISVLINNAGVFNDQPLDQIKISDFERVLDINIKGVFLMTKAIIPIMKKNKNGFILNIGSKISHNTNISPNKVLYATSKYAVEGFSFALNKELKKFGIRVSCLMLGTVATFVSKKMNTYLKPARVAEIIEMMIKFNDIDFEGLIIKSVKQDI